MIFEDVFRVELLGVLLETLRVFAGFGILFLHLVELTQPEYDLRLFEEFLVTGIQFVVCYHFVGVLSYASGPFAEHLGYY